MTGSDEEEILMGIAVEKGNKLSCAKAILSIIEYVQCSNNEVYRHQSEERGFGEVSVFECEFVRYIADTYLNWPHNGL